MVLHVDHLRLAVSYIIEAQATMRSRLNDLTFTYWFFLKGATSPNAGKYHTLAKAPLLILHLLMNINEPLISKITEAEELPSILSSVCHTVVNTKAMTGYKAILVMFDTVGSAGQRLTDAKDYFSLWEDSPGGTTKAMDLEDVFAPLRRISWLFRLAPSSDIVDVLQCLRSLQSTMSDNKMSALLTGYFQGLDLSARSKVMGGMLRLDKAVEGTHRWHEIGGKFYLHVPKKRKQAKDDNDDSRSDAEKHHLSLTNQLSATDASFMAKLIGGGDEAVGVREMTRVIATTNDDAFKEGANDEGHQLLSRLDVPTTVAVQMEIGLSEDQMNQTSSILSHVCGIAPLFADQKARQKYRMDAAKDVGQKFDKVGEMWRILFPGRATPKIHVLESHAPDQLERFGVLGLFSEDPVERLHHQHLVEIRRFCNVREYEKRERYIYSRWAAANTERCRKIIALWVQRRTQTKCRHQESEGRES